MQEREFLGDQHQIWKKFNNLDFEEEDIYTYMSAFWLSP